MNVFQYIMYAYDNLLIYKPNIFFSFAFIISLLVLYIVVGILIRLYNLFRYVLHKEYKKKFPIQKKLLHSYKNLTNTFISRANRISTKTEIIMRKIKKEVLIDE